MIKIIKMILLYVKGICLENIFRNILWEKKQITYFQKIVLTFFLK